MSPRKISSAKSYRSVVRTTSSRTKNNNNLLERFELHTNTEDYDDSHNKAIASDESISLSNGSFSTLASIRAVLLLESTTIIQNRILISLCITSFSTAIEILIVMLLSYKDSKMNR